MTLDPTTPEDAGTAMVGRRAMLGKIAVGGALVWASPLVTSTAHAAATGTCLTGGTLNWTQAPFNNWPIAGTTAATRTVSGVVTGTGVTVTAADALTGGYSSTNLTIGGFTLRDHRVQTIGGTNYVEFGQQRSSNPGTWNTAHRTATITFDSPVTNVQFHIRDIDIEPNSTYEWDDRLAVRANTGATVARTLSSDLTGNGNGTTNNASIRPTNTSQGNLTFPNDGGLGRANFTISGSVTQITIDYWSGDRANQQVLQQVFLSAISFGCA